MRKWISRLLSPTSASAAKPVPPTELAALVDLNMVELNATEALALLAQNLSFPSRIRHRLEAFSSAAQSLMDDARLPGEHKVDWNTIRRSARQLNDEFEHLRSELYRSVRPLAL